MCLGRRFNVHKRHCGTIARIDTTADFFILAGTPGQKFDTLHATISIETTTQVNFNEKQRIKTKMKIKFKMAPDGTILENLLNIDVIALKTYTIPYYNHHREGHIYTRYTGKIRHGHGNQ